MYVILPKKNGKWIYDPAICMAIQVYAKDHLFLDDDLLFPYFMEPVVQIGKFQNAYEEVNLDYLKEQNIQVLRRDTGGGAVYLDKKNISFCFLLDGEENYDIFGNYDRLYKPAVQALQKLGVKNVKQEGRNDLTIDGKKISGAAMTFENGRIYAGYSLLLDPDYETMLQVLSPNKKKIESHGIRSIESRMTSIRKHLPEKHKNITTWQFTKYMMCELLQINDLSEAKHYDLTEEDWEAIEKLAKEKYKNWDWTYGRFQQFAYQTTKRFPVGTITIGLTVTYGKIENIQITGDFFGTENINVLENALTDTRLEQSDLLNALNDFQLEDYFGKGFTKEQLVQLIFSIPEK